MANKLATHGEDINEIIDNLIQIIYSRIKKRAEEELRKEKLKQELNISKPIQSDLTNNIKEKIKNQSFDQNLNDFRKLERQTLEYELKIKSGYTPKQDEKDEYLLNCFKKDVYSIELKLSEKEKLEIRQDILETINNKNISNELLRDETMNNYQEINDLDRQEKILNTDLASQILSEIEQNKSLKGSISEAVKNEASNNISSLNKSYNDITKGISTSNNQQNKSFDIRHSLTQSKVNTDKLQSKENEIEKNELGREEIEIEIER